MMGNGASDPCACPPDDALRLRLVRQAGWIATFGNLALAVVKIFVGLFTGSLAVLSDGIDTAIDVGMGILLLCAAPIAARPPDPRYPHGRMRAEAVASKLLALIIIFIALHIVWAAIARVLNAESPTMPGMLAIVVTIISILAKGGLALNQYRLARRSGSTMVLANAINMRNDIITSAGVLVGLLLSHVLKAPILDPLTALLVAGWIMKSGIDIYRNAARELMDGVDDPQVYEDIAQAVLRVDGAGNPHRIRARRLAHRLAIDLDVEVDGTISVHQGHRISHAVEASICEAIPEIVDVVVHIEPAGKGHDDDTSFGVNPLQGDSQSS
ncbi:MAG: cation transporter [Planctomycetota bacterium]|nr:MAG: cation transporter [Planctomycetota bacterium]